MWNINVLSGLRCLCMKVCVGGVCAHHMNYKTKLHQYFFTDFFKETINSPIIDISTFRNLIPLAVL